MTNQWAPIKDLPDNWPELQHTEFESLAEIWKEQSNTLQKRDALRQFNDRLRREWAIETGIIENLYSIDRGITQILIEKGIEESLIPHGATDKPAEKIIPILKDQEDVLEGLFDFVAQRRDLSNSYIKELHQALTRHQDTVQAVNGVGRLVEVDLLRGDWKRQPNNPTRPNGQLHHYAPPEHVAAEMDTLIKLHHEHGVKQVPPEVEAAWLHHRFTQIHPFQDGNGRIARALASLVFLRASWFPLVINRDLRGEYIEALETADENNLSPLVDLFSRVQKKAFLMALSLSENVLQEPSRLRQVIAAAGDRLRARKFAHKAQLKSKAFEISTQLEDQAEKRLHLVAEQLNIELKTLDQNYFADIWRNDATNDFWFRKDIVSVAKDLNYYADTRTYRAWVRLRIKEDRQTDLVLAFHSLGVEFLGIMAVTAFMEFRDKKEDDEVSIDGPHVLSREVFQFSYSEQEAQVAERFDHWLSNVVLLGLDQWRKQL
ncbi:MAG: Fic family protein [bacterium]